MQNWSLVGSGLDLIIRYGSVGRKRGKRTKDSGMDVGGRSTDRYPNPKFNYMHKARTAGRNYHKDRQKLRIREEGEGTEILYTRINLRFIRGKGTPRPRDLPTATRIRFCLLSCLRGRVVSVCILICLFPRCR